MILSELIEHLEQFDEDWMVFIQPFGLTPTTIDSYRGYYEDLAISYDISSNVDRATVGELLKQLREVIGKELTGYKGGEFEMTPDTEVWVSNYGDVSSMGIDKVFSPFDNYVYIMTSVREDL